MRYVLFLEGKVVAITDKSPWTGTPKMAEILNDKGEVIQYDKAKAAGGSDMKSFVEATEIAVALNELTGKQFLPFDDGSGTSHQFGVIEAPAVGEEVSEGFNGDYYPCGKIVRITPSLRVTTADGTVFNRRKNSSRWVRVGGTFTMVKGIHDERNPSF